MQTIGVMEAGELELHLDGRDSSGVSAPGKEIDLNADGTFQADVLPGSYTLRLIGNTTLTSYAGKNEIKAEVVHVLVRQDIEVEGKDLYGLALIIPQPAVINGIVHAEGIPDSAIANAQVTLRPLDPLALGGDKTAWVQADGSFTITSCDTAIYAVQFSPPSGAYIKALAFNQQDAITHPMDLSRGTGGELEITVRADAASITVTVQATGEPGPPLDVVLIPNSWSANGTVPVIHATGKDEKFSFNGLDRDITRRLQ